MSKLTSVSVSLAEISSGDEVIICEDCLKSSIAGELEAMGVVSGVKYRVHRYGNLSVLDVDAMRIGLTFSVAKQIKVLLCRE